MATPKVYVICDANCKFEGMTKEQIITAIVNAVNNGTIGDIDTGFVQTIKTINGTPLRFFVGTQAEYNELTEDERANLFAIISDDATKDGILASIISLSEDVTSLKKRADILEKAEKTNTNAIAKNETALKANENILAEHQRKLDKTGVIPTKNEERILPTYGYYYIYAYDRISDSWYTFGAVWYSPMQTFGVRLPAYDCGIYENNSVFLSLSSDGEMGVFVVSGGSTSTLTFQCDFYTGLIAGF